MAVDKVPSRIATALERVQHRLDRVAHHPAKQPASGMTFNIRLHRDELDGGWIAECVNLPGCVSDGETKQEALTNVIDAIAEVVAARAGAHLPDVGREDEDQDRELALTI